LLNAEIKFPYRFTWVFGPEISVIFLYLDFAQTVICTNCIANSMFEKARYTLQ